MKTDIYEQTYFPFIKYAVRCDHTDRGWPASYVNSKKSSYVTLENASVYDTIDEAKNIIGSDEIIVPVYK